jgi:hypothetical protein
MPENDRLTRIERALEKLTESQKETDRLIKELRESQKETDRQIRELKTQVGNLTNSWGELPEEMLTTSVRTQFAKILKNLDFWGPRIKRSKNGETYETDFIIGGILNGVEVAIVVEVKLRPRSEDFAQLEQNIQRLPKFIKDFEGKKRIGCLAWLGYDEVLEKEAWRRGYYVLILSGDTARISNPEDFVPKMI